MKASSHREHHRARLNSRAEVSGRLACQPMSRWHRYAFNIRDVVQTPRTRINVTIDANGVRSIYADGILRTQIRTFTAYGTEDGGWADVWRVPLPAAAQRRARHNYGLEKWLLCDAFLRRAVRERAGFDFYALADDDTLFNLTTLHARLHPFAAAPQAHLVFGSVEECASHAARYGSKPRLAE